jgi:putative Mg2+ transporter-C (MgtC) family protein
MTLILQTGLNLAIATGLGAAIGFERQWRRRMASLRTNTLVEPTVSAASWNMEAVAE